MGQHIQLITSAIAADYFTMDAYQNSGGSLNITGASFALITIGVQ